MEMTGRFFLGFPSFLWAYFVTGQIDLLRTLGGTFIRYVKEGQG